jgi:hypothetical protein
LRYIFAVFLVVIGTSLVEAGETEQPFIPAIHKQYQISVEGLTPVGLGVDLSVFVKGHYNIGVGLMDGEMSWPAVRTGLMSIHPRYRYYRAQKAWDSFYEFGWTSAEFDSDNTDSTHDHTVINGISAGYGWAYVASSCITAHILLSIVGGQAIDFQRESNNGMNQTGYNENTVTHWGVFPMGGGAVGLAF